MDLTHHFHVPTGLGDTWTHFQDVAGLAGCFPGAQVSAVDGDDFTGSCKVKLGPIALVYTGTGTFTARDEDVHRLVVEAKGKDKRGNGTAAATATLTMSAASAGGTDVQVVTDLAITGKPAQFGRGLIQDVSDKLLGQFVACLELQLTLPAPVEVAPAPPVETAAPAGLASPAAPDAPSTPGAPGPTGAATKPTSAPHLVRSAPAQADALDLGATVLPVLIRSYWKPVAAGLGLIALALVIRGMRR